MNRMSCDRKPKGNGMNKCTERGWGFLIGGNKGFREESSGGHAWESILGP